MKNEKTLALLFCVAAIGFYLMAAVKFFARENGTTFLCLGSAMLCSGAALINKANKKDK